MEVYSEEFKALLNEAMFTKEILGIGVTQLYRANYAKKGVYYQSFICLSTGLERIGKLCLILDSYIENNGKFPNENYIRSHGHDIEGLYVSCYNIAKNRKIKFKFLSSLDKDIHKKILKILNSFAKSSGRYHNIRVLSNIHVEEDCMKQWKMQIDNVLYNECVSEKRKRRIEENARVIGDISENFALVRYIGEDGGRMSEIEKVSEQTGRWEAIAPYRQIYMLQIIRFFVEVLIELCYEAMKVKEDEKMTIPYMSEIFGIFYNSDSYFKRRKTWDKI